MPRIRRMHQAYSAGDVTVTLMGWYDINPTSIEYSYKYQHEYQRGLRREPWAYRIGQKEMEGKITLPIEASSILERIAPNSNLVMIKPFPIIVTFFNDENLLITDVIEAKFQGSGRSVTNDSELEYEYELFITNIQLNVP